MDASPAAGSAPGPEPAMTQEEIDAIELEAMLASAGDSVQQFEMEREAELAAEKVLFEQQEAERRARAAPPLPRPPPLAAVPAPGKRARASGTRCGRLGGGGARRVGAACALRNSPEIVGSVRVRPCALRPRRAPHARGRGRRRWRSASASCSAWRSRSSRCAPPARCDPQSSAANRPRNRDSEAGGQQGAGAVARIGGGGGVRAGGERAALHRRCA